MEVLLIVAILASGAALYVFKRSGVRRPDELDRACYHDVALANRLADFERERAPNISEAEARRRALERLYRDRAS